VPTEIPRFLNGPPFPFHQFGDRAPTWDILRHLNEEILALVPLLLRLSSTGVDHSPTAPAGAQALANSKLLEAIATPGYWHQPAVPKLLVGDARFAII
jgi:hypothetical protein